MRSLLAVSLFLPFAIIAADPKPLPKTPLSEPRQRLLKGNYAEARAGFEKLLDDKTHGPVAAIGIAQSWRETGELDKAAAAIEDGPRRHANHRDLLAARGDLHFDRGQWAEALADADAALKQDQNHFAARWVRARIIRDSGKLDEADAEMRWFVRAYTQASNADKDITDPDLLLLVGQAGAENARWNNLSKQFSFIINEVYGDALKYDPDFWPAEYLIGAMLLEKYNRPDAVEAFDKVLKMNPNAAEAYVGKGQAALQKFELKDAEEFAAEALRKNPKLPLALRFKADVHLMSGEFDAAEKALLASLEVNPKDAAALGKLAAVRTMQKKPIDDLVKQVEAFDARPGVFYQEMGEYLDDRKAWTKAQECYRRAAELRPKLAAPRTSLGMLLLRLGQEAEGRKLLDDAFKADKFNVRVANMRKVMEHLDRYTTIKTPHFEIKFDGTTDRLLAEFVAEYLEEVHADLKKQFQYEPPGLIPFEIFSKHEMFSGRTVGLPDLHTIGACTGRVVAMASPKAAGVAKPFNWGRVIRHELVHVFNLAQTDFQCPHWLTEGLAVRNEKMEHPHLWTQALRDAAKTNSLFNLDTVLLGFVRPKSQMQWTLAYAQSHLYVEYLVSKFGEAAIAKLLKAYADGLDTDAALKAACGVDKKQFEEGYRTYIDTHLIPFQAQKKSDADESAGMTFEQLQKAYDDDPNDLNVKARLSEQWLRRNKPGEARKLADEVLEKKNGHPVAAIVKSRLLQQAGDDTAAKEVLEAALKDAPDDTRLLIALGRHFVETKEYDKAAEVLEKGRKTSPLDGDWLTQLSRVYAASEQPDKLASVLEEIAAHDPDDLDARLKLGRALLDANKAKEALAYAKQAIQIDVTNVDAQKLFIECLQKTGGDAEKMSKRFQKQD